MQLRRPTVRNVRQNEGLGELKLSLGALGEMLY